jgi:LPXTG-motif cell wall-anchored protein
MAGIEILSSGEVDTLSTNESFLNLSQEFLVTSFDSGYYKIPSYPFVVSTPRVNDTLYSTPVFLAVHTLEVDTSKAIFDIKPPYAAPFTFKEGLPYLLVLIGILALGFGIFYFVRKRKKNEPVFKPSRVLPPPHVVALDELDKLDKEKLWQQGKIKIYYIRLTEITRTYIEDRFHVPAMEQITEEIMDGMKMHYPPDDPVMVKLNQLLELSDLAKFAKFLPTPSENKLAMEHAYNFVLATKPADIKGADNKKSEGIENEGTKIEA